MFNITDVKYGWLNLHIGMESFICSYLDDVEFELKRILELKDYRDVIRIEFDGEWSELYLTCFREPYRDILHIMWEEYQKGEIPRFVSIEYPYNGLCKEINNWFENNRKYYHDNFGYKFDD